MKTLIAAFLLISTSAFAQDLDATSALLGTMRSGEYSGVSPSGYHCVVSIHNYGSNVQVTVSADGRQVTTVVAQSASYRANPSNRSFLATTVTHTDDGSKEFIVRMLANSPSTQYVVTAELVTNNRQSYETSAECVVNL